MEDTIEIPRSWLETLLKHSEKAEAQLDSVLLKHTDIVKLIGYSSGAKTILKLHKP